MSEQPTVIEEVQIGHTLFVYPYTDGRVLIHNTEDRHSETLTAQEALALMDVLLRHAKLFEESEKQKEAT